MIKLWVKFFRFFFSDQVIICLFIELTLFEIIVVNFLFLCINKVSIFIGMFHMVDMVIGVIKLNCVQVWARACNFFLRMSCVFGCISVFIGFLWP